MGAVLGGEEISLLDRREESVSRQSSVVSRQSSEREFVS